MGQPGTYPIRKMNGLLRLTPSQMNFALAHVLGSTLQTALLNSSLVVIVGWGLGRDMVSLSDAEAT